MLIKSEKVNTGVIGEEAASIFLKNIGYQIIERNFKNRSGRIVGEIDIIAKDPASQELVFVEVKTRGYRKFENSPPEENITPSKLRKMDKAASAYLYAKKLSGANYRFDAISVWLMRDSGRTNIRHLKSIFL